MMTKIDKNAARNGGFVRMPGNISMRALDDTAEAVKYIVVVPVAACVVSAAVVGGIFGFGLLVSEEVCGAALAVGGMGIGGALGAFAIFKLR